MEHFAGNTADITLKHQHKWGCPFYILDARLQNISTSRLLKWDLRVCAVIYCGRSEFHTILVAMIPNPLNGHISNEYHYILNHVLLTLPFIQICSIIKNWADLVQLRFLESNPEILI